ncbi:(2Fe-2S) ferredoxin domain-containing protein [Kosmotoga pacifica]|uniref:NADH dehydrogenase n=1 Tax=Kosmotoga pacifica TaxID=1330330 RepID=A0A0G2Z554_9BACT|nr:NAD(P)H-dependent oxidoreductase subunit E [Kosmotoga pacifica]AKI96745.1 NADH dehydrogenase [Kosmotoga pacifica]
MEIRVCMGSACHIKGSTKIIARLQELIKFHNLSDKIDLKGSFCMGPCSKGVVAQIDGKYFYNLSEENVEVFFKKEILKCGE